jgi:3-phosphoshikimate 1-carboxyvinyltransferase
MVDDGRFNNPPSAFPPVSPMSLSPSSTEAAPAPVTARPAGPLSGDTTVPGDKSISHRAVMLGGIAVGETTIEGLLEGEDVLRTAAAMRALGAEAVRTPNGTWRVRGRGIGGLTEPNDVLDLGNSGTSARLLMGLLATSPFTTFLTGDASLRRRPMARVTTPLGLMGARVLSRGAADGKVLLPLAITGTGDPVPIVYTLPVPSAQVKSAVLLAGLNSPGETTVIERAATRDHTELMLRHFGADVRVKPAGDGATAITVAGRPEITGRAVRVPADPSSAAFPLIAALLVPGSRVTVRNVGLNPRRAGVFETLKDMGADLAIANARVEAGEPVGDVTASAGSLKGVEVPPERAPTMIDEYPILAVAAAFATGDTRMRGLSELRVKESDRLTAIAQGLAACGAEVLIDGDDLIVRGTGRKPRGLAKDAAPVATNLDHRIAMAFLVMGLAAENPVTVDDARPIDTSFPGFAALMRGLGAEIA